jgi:hypothetical protein
MGTAQVERAIEYANRGVMLLIETQDMHSPSAQAGSDLKNERKVMKMILSKIRDIVRNLNLRLQYALDQGECGIACDEEACEHYGIEYGYMEGRLWHIRLYVSGFIKGLMSPLPHILLWGSGYKPSDVADALIREGITDYCGQVCGGGNCGSEVVCMNGIDSSTGMPPTTMSVQQ